MSAWTLPWTKELATGWTLEFDIPTPPEDEIWVDNTQSAMRDNLGNIIYFTGDNQDA